MEPVPKQIVIITGDEQKLTQIIDSFFAETKEHIEKKYPGTYKFSMNYSPLTSEGRATDNELTFMMWQDRVVAGVLCTRTDLNNVQYTFFRALDEVKRMYNKK
jgi:hypothetical protein